MLKLLSVGTVFITQRRKQNKLNKIKEIHSTDVLMTLVEI